MLSFSIGYARSNHRNGVRTQMNDQSAAMKPRRDVSLDAPSTRQGQMDQDNRLGANQSQWRVGSVNLMNRYAMLWAKRKEGGVWRTASWVLLGAALWGM